MKPTTSALMVMILADPARNNPTLIVAKALLRLQLLIPRRSVKCHRCPPVDCAPLVLLVRRIRAGRQTLLIA